MLRYVAILLTAMILLAAPVPASAQAPVMIRVFPLPDTLVAHPTAQRLIFYVNANGHKIASLIFGLELNFTEGNVFGAISDSAGDVYSSYFGAGSFEQRIWHEEYGNGTNPDTLLYIWSDTDQVYYEDPNWRALWHLWVRPTGEGALTIDTIAGIGDPPTFRALGAMDSDSNWLPVQWDNLDDTIVISELPLVQFSIETSTGSDTLFAGVPTDLIFNLNPNGNILLGVVFPMEFVFSGAHVLGPLQPSNIIITPEAEEIYELGHGANMNFWDGSGTDSLLVVFTDGGGDHWLDSAELWRLATVPQTTGTFHLDSIVFPPANRWEAIDDDVISIPFEIVNYGREYVVVLLNGDVTGDGIINSSDIIYLINFDFKGGPRPPVCEGIADVNCSEEVTSADIIYLVNHIFKSGAPPCDLTPLIPDTWICPE